MNEKLEKEVKSLKANLIFLFVIFVISDIVFAGILAYEHLPAQAFNSVFDCILSVFVFSAFLYMIYLFIRLVAYNDD